MRQRDDLSRIRIPAAQSQRKAFLENNVAPELAVPGDVGDAEASLGNQLLAKSADEVYFMVAGLPLTVKKG